MSAEKLLRHRQWPELLFLFFLSVFSLAMADELQPLLKLKSSLRNSDTAAFSSWTSVNNSVCNFSGIFCDSNGLVLEINLSQQNLSGVLPFDSLCSLRSLEKISLGSNFLTGRISEDLKNCTTLKHLDLGMNYFSGEFPEFSALSELKFLNLNSSGFSGLFPWKSLQNLTNLVFLSLGDNLFDESPFPKEVLELRNLYWLYLTNCSINGGIPFGIGNLSLLENLELSYNQLTGEIPADIVNLNKLWQLELYQNSLTGKIPDGFRNLTSLMNFDASQNKLEGNLMELSFLANLSSLQLFENQFSGVVPQEFGEFKNLVGLSLYSNKLTGSLPPNLGSWADFIFIDVSENFLSGPIPPDMCKNGKMTRLLLLHNNFNGGIPESYSNCKSLIRLRVNENSLTGHVPSGIWSLPDLIILDLSTNKFEGPVTSDIGKAKSLAQLFLSHNRFSDELPATISEASMLVSIQLSSNRFVGPIPDSLGELKKLGNLDLNENMFIGKIPSSLGSCISLSELNLAGNSLSGEISGSIGYLPNLNFLNLSKNNLVGEIPSSFSSLKLILLDLSDNKLVGDVPESLLMQASATNFAGNPGLCSQTVDYLSPCSSDSGKAGHLPTIWSCFIAGVMSLLVSLSCFLFLKIRREQMKNQLKIHTWKMKPYHVLSFTEKEIAEAIKPENLIGKGASGNVYKVQLSNGKEVAVKQISTLNRRERVTYESNSPMLAREKYRSPECDAEVATLSSIRHVNVVKLYCSITSEDSSLLVYEYLSNGSLYDQLHSTRRDQIGWKLRYQIALGAARGLEYLHHGCGRQVIHRDVKSSNILLDDDWNPKIADFGLAKIEPAEPSHREWSHLIAGTLGYIAPEYAYTSKINEKSDVYSFGVVLMELVTGKRPVEAEFGDNRDIVDWVICKMKSRERMEDLVDSRISDKSMEDGMKMLRISLHCTRKVPSLRPSMSMVVQMLQNLGR